MHYSASIAQLVATVIMTVLRVIIRRHISQAPKQLSEYSDGTQQSSSRCCHKDKNLEVYAVRPLKEGFELDTIAMELQECHKFQVATAIGTEVVVGSGSATETPAEQKLNT